MSSHTFEQGMWLIIHAWIDVNPLILVSTPSPPPPPAIHGQPLWMVSGQRDDLGIRKDIIQYVWVVRTCRFCIYIYIYIYIYMRCTYSEQEGAEWNREWKNEWNYRFEAILLPSVDKRDRSCRYSVIKVSNYSGHRYIMSRPPIFLISAMDRLTWFFIACKMSGNAWMTALFGVCSVFALH